MPEKNLNVVYSLGFMVTKCISQPVGHSCTRDFPKYASLKYSQFYITRVNFTNNNN